jgi:hypothetical protein
MTWEVHWLADAEQALAAIWLAAPNRSIITQAANDIDRTLATNPLGVGESRLSNSRIHFATPLGVLYRVYIDRGLVEVGHVWRFETHA